MGSNAGASGRLGQRVQLPPPARNLELRSEIAHGVYVGQVCKSNGNDYLSVS